ncbi:phospho-sugar mutase [Glycomyces sp. TRM65418]|uniref:phospho-sugar mutase n=1 Tax=Glycomyces sp. TRM65418 TaxID=2867006 RepID=UPI001CE6441A|nr:phospho-sugar mutase [Glycomyces sp. TRM65418]MCC3762731.1 phospho-sugar mutase [Glycomyces sp. TRM65418]QZD56764.1 phospho-sugar mutase [Glycomyces sp. TRM65418]
MEPVHTHDATDLDALRAEVLQWITDDPDKDSRDELYRLLDGLPATAAELSDRFAGRLRFGTAGLRGPLRAGPNGMNLAVVRAAAAGLASWLDANGAEGPVVIGYDARHRSRDFAVETARVVTGSGRRALVMPGPLPTPVTAFAVTRLDAAAAVQVTASHNPPQDNGYKVYLGRGLGGDLGAGAQIIPPADTQIEAAIEALGPLSEIPLGDEGETLDESIVDQYLAAVASVVDPDDPKRLAAVATPMHGVGGATLVRAMERAGFPAPTLVPEQADPDPDFPTVAFPNPEEPGAIDLLTALAVDEGADVAIALDPDADRCSVAIPVGDGTWRQLSGNEVGVLLADHWMRKGHHGTYATTIVSTTQLKAMCDKRGFGYEETLTGFKWLARAGADLAFAFEEALGYCVAPGFLRDKDGISAALVVSEIAAGQAARFATLQDRLDELAEEFGVFETGQLSVRVEDLSEIGACMKRLRAHQPTTLLDEPVVDYHDRLPDADVVTVTTANARVVARPSGTEPKLKAYLEVREDVGGDLTGARERARASVQALRAEVAAILGVPHY